MRRWTLVAGVAVAAMLAATACSSSSGGSSSASGPVTLTIWENYGTEQNATALKNLAAAFHKQHPNVTVNVVSQPATNYFALLQAAAVSKTGPDLAVMWTGLFTLQYKDFLTNLQGKVPASALARIDPDALKWTSNDFNASNGPYVIPLENQFYIGFYNKAAFTKAGVTSVPTDWNQLFAACKKLKAAGYLPMTYGNGGQPLGAEFYPWYDMSYMMIGSYPVSEWQKLYSGQIPWTSSTNAAQLSTWAKLKSSGCTNSDVLTKTDNLGDFETGKAAMMVDGTWDTQKFTSALGSKVAAFVPPFSNTPIKGVVDFAGDGLSMTTYAKHPTQATQFLTFMTTPQAGAIVNAAGLIPAIKGMSTSNPVNQQMLNFVSQDHLTAYPMLDNVVQPEVVTTGSKVLPSVLNGSMTPSAALQNMQTTFGQLPAASRGTSYP
ncbi:MAG TPA: extracellular solute-binding protein [Streptosporangiaceae bacterium]|nr:extracellular solute-binding protein [Streptosporangiaceae bacterium]